MPRSLPAVHKSTRKGAYFYTFGVRGGGGLLGHDKQIKRSRSSWEATCSACKFVNIGAGKRCSKCRREYEKDGWNRGDQVA